MTSTPCGKPGVVVWDKKLWFRLLYAGWTCFGHKLISTLKNFGTFAWMNRDVTQTHICSDAASHINRNSIARNHKTWTTLTRGKSYAKCVNGRAIIPHRWTRMKCKTLYIFKKTLFRWEACSADETSTYTLDCYDVGMFCRKMHF